VHSLPRHICNVSIINPLSIFALHGAYTNSITSIVFYSKSKQKLAVCWLQEHSKANATVNRCRHVWSADAGE